METIHRIAGADEDAALAGALEQLLRSSPLLGPLLDAVDRCGGPGQPALWLAAGCVAQTVWNARLGRAADAGIRDIDVVYHDDADLSEEAEAAQAARLRCRVPGLAVPLDVKNQARVHLWYGRRFGRVIPPYPDLAAAVASFPATATAIAVGAAEGRFQVLAPFGLGDLFALRVRPNTRLVTRAAYEAKAARWRAEWPGLTELPWPEPARERE